MSRLNVSYIGCISYFQSSCVSNSDCLCDSVYYPVYFVLLILPVTVSYSESRYDSATANVYFESLVLRVSMFQI